jgi:hypothetical protein
MEAPRRLALAARRVVFVVTVEATEVCVAVPGLVTVVVTVPETGCVACQNVPVTGMLALSTVTCPSSRAARSVTSGVFVASETGWVACQKSPTGWPGSSGRASAARRRRSPGGAW